MKNVWVLDISCGSGRFAEITLSTGEQVVALDYSSAVEAWYANLHPNLHVVQGDIYELPFVPNSFTLVYSLGVLQHTPDVAKAFAALPPMVQEGWQLYVDYYEKSFKSRLFPKYWLMHLTKLMDKQRLFSLVQRAVAVLLSISRILGRIPLAGKLLRRTIPVANYEGILPLTETQLLEWAILDTFDWLSPAYENPQIATTSRHLEKQAGLRDIEVLKAGHLVTRARK
jgi:SAM-dependent methyltransferase